MHKITKTTPEFTLYRDGSVVVVELDGVRIGVAEDSEHAHRLVLNWTRKHRLRDVGVTEVFGRNRQFRVGPRGGLKREKFE